MRSPQASPPQAPASPADLPSTSRDGGQHPAAAPSELPDTSQAALKSEENLSNEAQVSLPGEVFRARPTGRRPRGRPRTRWRDYVSWLAWERLGVPPEELE